MTKDKALKLALEAIEGVLDDSPKVLEASITGGLYEVVQCRDAITSIKEALANEALDKMAENARELGLDYEPAQEPVAWEGGEGWESLAWELCADENGEDSCNELIWEGGPIPEPWGDRWMKYEEEAKRLIALVQKHTTPPQRTWVGLTDIDYAGLPLEQVGLVRWAEAKLKEKNT